MLNINLEYFSACRLTWVGGSEAQHDVAGTGYGDRVGGGRPCQLLGQQSLLVECLDGGHAHVVTHRTHGHHVVFVAVHVDRMVLVVLNVCTIGFTSYCSLH